jgi:hypothetical protein
VAELADAQDLGFCAPTVSNLLTDAHHSTRFISAAKGRFLKVALLCSFLFIVGLQISESVVGAQERKTFTVPFHTVGGLILVDGQVNGKPAVFLLDTGANNSVVDYRSAGYPNFKLDALRSTGGPGSSGDCFPGFVKISLEHRSWIGRTVCVMNLSDVSKRMGTKIDGFIGADLLATFSAVRIDYRAQTVTLED